MRCEIILTGNELLIGKIVDSNGVWTISKLTHLGVRITQVSIIRDDLNEIAACIRAVLDRSPDYLLISGGLGPTFDDMTLKGIQLCLYHDLEMILNIKAEEWILERYHTRFPSKTDDELLKKYPYIKKMASLPKEAKPLKNLVGTAPGVYIDSHQTNGKTILISMPGVPEEYKSMFSAYILPEITTKMESVHFFECGFTFQNLPESGFANKIYQIKDNYPQMWFKTHPRRSQDHQWLIELHISSFTDNKSLIHVMEEIYLELLTFVEKEGGKIVNRKSPKKKEILKSIIFLLVPPRVYCLTL